jgi:hypothetical protein
MFQIQYPIIRSIPPISTDMPYDVLLSYIYLDSLIRFTTQSQTDSMIKSRTSLNDTLKNTIKYLYKLQDYNPIIFKQYWDEVRRYHVSSGRKSKVVFKKDGFTMPNDSEPNIPYQGRYTNDLYSLIFKITDGMPQKITNDSDRAALFSLMEAEYILRVRILSLPDSMYYRIGRIDSNDTRYQVMAEVLDTIKGKVFKNYNFINNGLSAIKTGHNNFMLDISNPIIKIQYSSLDYNILGGMSNGITYLYPDSAFLSNRRFNLQPNQECIIFLVHESHFLDSTNDYYDLTTAPRASACALPIFNGMVRDVNNVWSQDLYLPYDIWKNRINALINKILTATY